MDYDMIVFMTSEEAFEAGKKEGERLLLEFAHHIDDRDCSLEEIKEEFEYWKNRYGAEYGI